MNKVTLPHDPCWYPLEWAYKNCPSYMTNDLEKDTDRMGLPFTKFVNYYFEDERDAALFALRWA